MPSRKATVERRNPARDLGRSVGGDLAHPGLDEGAQHRVARRRAGIDRPGVGLDAEVEQPARPAGSPALRGDHGVEPQIGEGDAGPAVARCGAAAAPGRARGPGRATPPASDRSRAARRAWRRPGGAPHRDGASRRRSRRSRPATAAAASAIDRVGERRPSSSLRSSCRFADRRSRQRSGAAPRGRRATRTGASGSAAPVASRWKSPAIAASGMRGDAAAAGRRGAERRVVQRRRSGRRRRRGCRPRGLRRAASRARGCESLNGASARRVRSLCHFSRIGPCGPSTAIGGVAVQRRQAVSSVMPADAPARRSSRRSLRRVEHQRIVGREADRAPASPAACAAEEPCSSTRTWPTPVSTT